MNHFNIDTHPKIETGFKTPDDYFDQFDANVLAKIAVTSNETKVIPLYKKWKIWIPSVAAVIAIALFVSTYWFNSNEEIIVNEDFLINEANLSTEDISEQLSDADISSIEESLKTNDTETTNYVNDLL